MSKLVSVIVPVFNVEKYVSKCLDSILNQDYSDIEIIIVDDGSTDKSSEICKKYFKKYVNIHYYYNENGGLSFARNFGISKANGKYIMFVDSDDYISSNIISKAIIKMEEDKSDICCFAKKYVYNDSEKVVNSGLPFCINNIEALRKMLLKDNIDNSACDKIYKKTLFNNIKFPQGKYYEDIGTIYKIFMKSKKVSHISDIGYYYVIRSNSITTEKFSLKQLDYIELAKNQMNDIKKKYPQLNEESESFYYLSITSLILKYYNSENKEEFKNTIIDIKKIFNDNYKKMLKNKYIPFYKKIMCVCIKFNLYNFIIFVKNLKKRM